MAHFLVRPLSRRISTSSLPESFRYCTASLPKAYRHRHITFHEPLKKANRNSDTNGAPDHRKLYNEEEIGLIANGEDRSRLTIQMSPYQKTEADLSPVLSEGTSSALGTTTDDNVFITTADVVKSDLRTPSPQAPVIQVIEPEPDDNEQKPTDLDFKRRFLANKSASVSDPKFDESSDDAPARSSSESNLQKISPPGFLKSLLRGFQSKSRSRERMRIRSNASSSSERKSSLKEESSDAHSPPVKHKKMSLTVPTWKSILRSLSEDSRNAGGGHSSGEMHKAASDSLYIHESGHLKQTGRKWWKRWKDTGKLSASDDVRLTNNLCIEDDREVSVGTITQSDDEKMRLQRTWSDKPQLQRYPSVEQLDKHKRSLSFTPVRKKRRRRKTRPRDSSRKEPRIEPESRSLPFVPSDTEVDTGASQRKERRELTPRQRSWSDPCITFHILERKVSVWRTTRSKSRRRREAKNTPAESTIVNVC